MADNERDEHVERKSKTLFIRNLPFSTTNEKLETLFSEVGPVRTSFVVKEKDSSKCKGYGYVTYSVFEDAEAALSKIKSLDGRKLSVAYANKKKKQKKKKPKVKIEEKSEDESDKDSNDEEDHPQKPRSTDNETIKTHSQQEIKYLRAKTLVIQGLSSEHSQGDVEEIMTKLNVKNIAKVKFPAPDRPTTCAFVRFKSIRDTNRAFRKIDGKEVKGCALKACQLSKENTQPAVPSKPQKTVKKGRLIIRNLSFKCSEEKLRETFEKFGDVTEVQIPKLKNGKHQGFGIVQFQEVGEASTAIKEMNSKFILNRPVAVDWAIPKDKFQAKMNNFQEKEASVKQEMKAGKGDKQKRLGVRDDSNNARQKRKTEEDDDDSDDESEADEDSEVENSSESRESEESDEEKGDNSGDNSDDETDSDEEMEDSDDDDDDESETSESDDDTQTMKRKKILNRKSDVGEGRTLFIRNVPFEADEENLEEVFSEYGKVNYVKMVMNSKTGQPKGTAFVQFKTQKDAEKFRAAAEDEEEEGIIVDGRRLNVVVALEREKAQDLSGQKAKVKEDKRNLHLVREGMIRPGTQAAIGLTKDDLLKRTKLENVKRAKLKNPNIFVSTTRLSVHNIPTQVTDKQLRSTFLRAANSKAAVITECRIMRDSERLNSKKVGKSRGFAFINFTSHEHALTALRNANNNMDLFGEMKRLIVEFSLENKAALEAKEKRMERQKGRREALKKDPTRKVTEEKEFKNKKKSQVDKFIGTLPGSEEGKKLPKGLPSHWGAKVRHKPRPATAATKKPQKMAVKRKHEDTKVSSPQVSVMKTKKRRTDRVDDFDMLVNKYKQNMLSKSDKSKWFDR